MNPERLLQFAGDHPLVFCFCFACLVMLCGHLYLIPFGVLRYLFNRAVRHRNILQKGWPPAHLDADGDHVDMDH